MSIQSLTAALTALMTTFKTDRETIIQNGGLSESAKKAQVEALYQSTLPRAESAVAALFGGVVQNEDGSYILSPDGEIWLSLARAEVSLRQARDAATKMSFPSGVDGMLARLKTILAQFGTPNEFIQYYNSEASQEERAAAQDFLQGMISSADWREVFSNLKMDRRERVTTRQVDAARAALDQTVTDIEAAAKAANMVINEFGRNSAYLPLVERGIRIQMVEPRVQRLTWGVAMMSGQNLFISVDATM